MKTVIEMARDAGDDEWKILVRQVMKHFPDEFEHFTELVRADEREHIAKFVEDVYVRQFKNPWREDLAAAIRARSNT